MAGEVDNTNSMSDKDRDMANRFSGAEKSPEVKDADDDETAEKKDKDSKKDEKGKKQVKIPRKLFGGEGSKESAAEEEPAKKPEKNLFAGLLKKEAKIDGSEPAHAEEAEQNPEQQLVEHTEEAPNETQGELTEDFQELVIDRLQEVEHELELPLVPEKAAEVVADAEFLEHVGERLEEGLSPEDAIDDALEDEFIPPEADATEQDLNDAENFEESDDDDPAATNQSQTQIPPPTPTPIPRRPVTPSPTTPAPPRPTPPSPPIPPIPPVPNPNLYTAPPTPNVVSAPNVVPMNEMYTRNRRTGDILLGGILGYMIGRRGGRKRTEARMQPEIDERDKALEDLGRKLDESEKKVRTITSERIIKEPELVNRVRDAEEPKAVIAEKLVENADTVSIEREKRIIEQQEKEFENILTEQTERSIERSNAEISDPIPVPMIERAPQPAPEARTQTEVIGEFREKRKDVKTMTVSELLEVGDNIFLEKTS
ncbi:hypothetical protein KC992_01215, partial [Candidatus Saccharibacteria bacterium]|nr:hypothetical protein [Candidatus Saccharibacteria bacterium]